LEARKPASLEARRPGGQKVGKLGCGEATVFIAFRLSSLQASSLLDIKLSF
jgi:hypothetical protein